MVETYGQIPQKALRLPNDGDAFASSPEDRRAQSNIVLVQGQPVLTDLFRQLAGAAVRDNPIGVQPEAPKTWTLATSPR